MREFFFICLLFVAEAALALIFVTPDYAVKQSVREAQWIELFLGVDSAQRLQERADETYRIVILETGADQKIGRIIPSEEERAKSKGLERLGETIWPHIQERIDALLDLFYWFIRRLHLLLMWLPACIPALAASAISGLLTRRIKQTNFHHLRTCRSLRFVSRKHRKTHLGQAFFKKLHRCNFYGSKCFPRLCRLLSANELIKKGNSKSHKSMLGTVDHPFIRNPHSQRPDSRCCLSHHLRDLSYPVRSGSQ